MRYNKEKGLLCNRVGSPNAQYQKHSEGNTAPVRRGIWAFPWPLMDYFFVAHQANKFKKKSDEWVSVDLWNKLRKNELKTKQIWWNKPFYSRLKPDPKLPDADWYLWEDFREFIKTVEQSRFAFGYCNGEFYKVKYSIDSLELFLPMTSGKLPRVIR